MSVGLDRDVPITGDGTRWWFISSGSSVDRKPGKSVLNADAEVGGDGAVDVDVDVVAEVEGPATGDMGDMSLASPELTNRDMARLSDQQSRPSVVGGIKRDREEVRCCRCSDDWRRSGGGYSVVRPMSFRAKCTTKRAGTPRPHVEAQAHGHNHEHDRAQRLRLRCRAKVRSVGMLHEPPQAAQPRVESHALRDTVDDCRSDRRIGRID